MGWGKVGPVTHSLLPEACCDCTEFLKVLLWFDDDVNSDAFVV